MSLLIKVLAVPL